MGRWSWRCRRGGLGLVAAAVLVMVAVAAPARAACYGPQQQLPAAALTQFKADPAQILKQFPSGGAQMISMIRDLVASDPTTLPLILDLAAKANADQINAIGTGLGDGALICVKTDQAFATEIQQMVAALGNETLAQAFTGVLGDQGIASVGGGGGGGAGGGGEEGTGSSSGGGFLGGTSNFFLTTGTTNNGSNYFTSNYATGATPGTTTTTTTTTSVSPSK